MPEHLVLYSSAPGHTAKRSGLCGNASNSKEPTTWHPPHRERTARDTVCASSSSLLLPAELRHKIWNKVEQLGRIQRVMQRLMVALRLRLEVGSYLA